MRLFLYDLFIWINVFAIFAVFWNKKVHGNLQWLTWTLTVCFGGIGTWVGLFFAYLRKKREHKLIALILGLVQVVLLQDLIGEFLFRNF